MNDEPKQIAEKLIQILKEKGHEVVTELTKADSLWKAEDKHQQYYTKGEAILIVIAIQKNFREHGHHK